MFGFAITESISISLGSTPLSSNSDIGKWDLLVDAASAAASQSAAAASATAAANSQTAAATANTNAQTANTNAQAALTSANSALSSAQAAQGRSGSAIFVSLFQVPL